LALGFEHPLADPDPKVATCSVPLIVKFAKFVRLRPPSRLAALRQGYGETLRADTQQNVLARSI
jgi:hypothetical protein